MKQRCRYCQTSFDANLDKCPKCKKETYKGPSIGSATEKAYHKTYQRGSFYESDKSGTEKESECPKCGKPLSGSDAKCPDCS